MKNQRRNGSEVYKSPLKHRLAQHLAKAKGKHYNPHLANKIKKLGAENVEIFAIESTDDANRFEREYALIRQYLLDGCVLANILTNPEDSLKRARQKQVNPLGLPQEPLTFVNNILDYANFPADQYERTKLAEKWNQATRLYVWWAFYGCQENIDALDKYLGKNLLQSTYKQLEQSLRFSEIYECNYGASRSVGALSN